MHRHGKVVGAVIGPQELKRLQHLEPPPPPLSDFERKQKARETLARHRAMSQPLSRAYEAVALARAGTDPLALATAEFELEELQAQSEALSREWMDLEAPR